jgi:hypothetical protein
MNQHLRNAAFISEAEAAGCPHCQVAYIFKERIFMHSITSTVQGGPLIHVLLVREGLARYGGTSVDSSSSATAAPHPTCDLTETHPCSMAQHPLHPYSVRQPQVLGGMGGGESYLSGVLSQLVVKPG